MKGLKVTEGSKFEEIFKHEEFGEVRTIVGEDGEPWFVGKDVATALGYKNTRDALYKHVEAEDKDVAFCDTLGGKQKITVINEFGLYSLILSSKLESAKKFKRWVTSEVLPSIRKHGVYITEELLADKEKLEKAIEDFTEENAKLKNKLKKVEPYVTFTQDYLHRDDRYVTTTTIANHYNVSARVLNKFLEQRNIQYKKGSTWYMCNEEHAKTLGKHIPLYDRYNHYSYTVWEWNRQGEFFIHKLLQEFLDEHS